MAADANALRAACEVALRIAGPRLGHGAARPEAHNGAMDTREPELDRRTLLGGAAALGLGLACASTGRPTQRPKNLLVLLADDLSGRDLGCYGNADARTPAIDALARDGVRFERAYTAVGVCQPSRSSLYTGLYPHRHGAMGFGPIRADVATWPELLRERGVFTAMVGKLDVDPLEKFPFEHLLRAVDLPVRRDPAVWEHHMREVIERAADRPFAALLAFVDPHRPFDEEAGAPLTDPERVRVPAGLWDTPGTRAELAQYLDCVARLDRSVERVLAVLEQTGRARDTLVVLTSDNGASFPFAKSTLYEPGVRMPLIVRGPGVASAVHGEHVSLLDLLPTALELFGAQARELDGRSLVPLLLGGQSLGRQSFVTMQTENNREQARPARALHTARYKYIRNFGPDVATVSNVVGHTQTWESGKRAAASDPAIAARMRAYLYRPQEELYDLASDPAELTNLADAPQHADVLTRSRNELRTWMEAHGDPSLGDWGA